MRTRRLLQIKKIISMKPYLLPEFKKELERDLRRTWSRAAVFLGNENFYEVLRLLMKCEKDEKKRRILEEIKETMDRLVFLIINYP